MLWILEGDNGLKKTKEIEKIKNKVSPDDVVRYDTVSEDVVFLKDSQDLFGEKKLVIVSEANTKDFLHSTEEYHVSPHYFVFCVDTMLAATKKGISQSVAIVECFSQEKEEKFNNFSLCDALLAKNKKDLWVLYQKASRFGVPTQELVNVLLWQIRVLLSVLHASEKDAGLKPFVVTKAKKALSLFTQDALEGYVKDLVSMSHDQKRGDDIKNSFERFILNL